MMIGSVQTEKGEPMLREIERHDNCTVIICQDDQTGEIDISWFDNDNPPALIVTLEEDT